MKNLVDLKDNFVNYYNFYISALIKNFSQAGKINNVIKFFEKEVARLYKILCNAEDDLINYNIEKRIINYGSEAQASSVDSAKCRA